MSSIASSIVDGVGKSGANDSNWNCTVADRNPDFMTGAIIASGTIAGGTGAALTGGNFWQGAVTGFFVSAFNHAMSHRAEGNRAEQAVKHLKGKPAAGNDAIQTVANLDALAEDYASGGSPKVGSDIKYVANTSSPDYANTDMSNGNISIYKKSFSSWKTLYLKVAHELSHRFDYISNSYAGWKSSYGSTYARAVSETYAYDRESWWNGGNTGLQLNSFNQAAVARLYNSNFQPKWRQ